MAAALFATKLPDSTDQVRLAIDPARIAVFTLFVPLVRNENRALFHLLDRTVIVDETQSHLTGSRRFPDGVDTQLAGLYKRSPNNVRPAPGCVRILVFPAAGHVLHQGHDVRKRFQSDSGISPYSPAMRRFADLIELLGRKLGNDISQGVVNLLQIVRLAESLKNPPAMLGIMVTRLYRATERVPFPVRAVGIDGMLVVGIDIVIGDGHDKQVATAGLAYRKVAVFLVRRTIEQIVFFCCQLPAQGIKCCFHHLKNLFVDFSLPDLGACARAMAVVSVLMLPVSAPAQDTAEPITVYTVSALPVSVPKELAAHTAVIRLDRATAIEEELARGIHALTPETRLSAVQGRFTPALQRETVRIWEAIGWVREHADYLPAIRIGDRSLYYGFDLRRAMTLHRQAGGE